VGDVLTPPPDEYSTYRRGADAAAGELARIIEQMVARGKPPKELLRIAKQVKVLADLGRLREAEQLPDGVLASVATSRRGNHP
jgi:hypothetical protein